MESPSRSSSRVRWYEDPSNVRLDAAVTVWLVTDVRCVGSHVYVVKYSAQSRRSLVVNTLLLVLLKHGS
jgi:hypothetical protein